MVNRKISIYTKEKSIILDFIRTKEKHLIKFLSLSHFFDLFMTFNAKYERSFVNPMNETKKFSLNEVIIFYDLINLILTITLHKSIFIIAPPKRKYNSITSCFI